MTDFYSVQIRDALTEATTAIPYQIRLKLLELRPTAAILQGQDTAFDIDSFARAGHCHVRPRDGFADLVERRWLGEPWGVWSDPAIRWLEVTWQDQQFECIETSWEGRQCQTQYRWLVAPDEASGDRFWAAVCRWNHEVRGEVLVFHGGRWYKDEALFKAIRGTQLASLVLPAHLADEIQSDLRRFLESRDAYAQYGIPWKRGILLTGPPGNGKTHCIKGLVNALRIPCLYVKSFVSQHGTDQGNIHSVFRRARETSPCLLILEDLDSLITRDNRSFFLNELDGFAANTGIVTLATTNHPEELDPAIRDRPSRFDRTWNFTLPALGERHRYIAQWSGALQEDLRLQPGEVDRVAAETEGFSFAYLKELFVSALMRWINEPQGQRSMAGVLASQVTLLRAQMSITGADAARADAVHNACPGPRRRPMPEPSAGARRA